MWWSFMCMICLYSEANGSKTRPINPTWYDAPDTSVFPDGEAHVCNCSEVAVPESKWEGTYRANRTAMACLLRHGGLQQFLVRNHTLKAIYFWFLRRICVATLESAACFAEPIVLLFDSGWSWCTCYLLRFNLLLKCRFKYTVAHICDDLSCACIYLYLTADGS